MAKKSATKTKVNKSAAIREMLKLHPDKGPTEISNLLKESQNIDAPPSMVSNIKGAGAKKKPKGKKRGRPIGSGNRAATNGNGHGYLDSAFDFVAKVGGLLHAEQLIDKLKDFKSKL
jgi:hypothetical protein